jgi:hypothetical protein
MRALVLLAIVAAFPLEAQQTAAGGRSQAAGVISVGPNVQVSKPFPRLFHGENLAAADPDNAGRLLACSTVAHQDLASQGNHCYVSFDHGRTWSTALEFDDGPRNSDPAMTYGRGDTVFYVNEHIPGGNQNRMEIWRSADGGRTWKEATRFTFVDRQGIIVDETNGRFAGRIYVNGVSKGFDGGEPASVVLYRSLDGGSTFIGPVVRPTVEGPGLLGASNPVVLSDGTLAFTTFMFKRDRSTNLYDEIAPRSGNAQLQLVISSDGGESYDPWITISDAYLDLAHSQGALYAQVAVDPGSRFFKDRLYAVWPDARTGRINVHFAYSTDKGKSWSTPIIVNDDRPPLERLRGPDQILPAIAVNKAGAILVAWYDRRESGDNMGWKIRASASLDGGLTFTPSAVVSDGASTFTDRTEWVQSGPRISGGGSRRAPASGRPISVAMSIDPFFVTGGHTSGMAVGADDVFYPVWTDNRTGIAQMWTAPVTVRGAVTRHGAGELAQLDDVTDRVALEARSTSFDRATGTLTLTARLRNTSREALRGPVKVRVIRLSSQLGVPSVVGAANGINGTGAILDFDATIPRSGLLPDSAGAPRALTFRLADIRPLRPTRQSPGFTSGLIQLDVRVYARGASADRSAQ